LATSRKALNWTVIGPVALIAAIIVVVLAFDATTGGAAKPGPLLGDIGTPVRGTYVRPTVTPTGTAARTPQPKATFGGVAKGNAAERDARRRIDLLTLADAANKQKAKDGAYPVTSKDGNVQTLCAFSSIDAGCKFQETLGGKFPTDPFGEPVKNGYWYASDGQTAKFYAALEGNIGEELKCATNSEELKKKLNLICITVP
jgi:hypothetical protein